MIAAAAALAMCALVVLNQTAESFAMFVAGDDRWPRLYSCWTW
jgi:hypothetical protein